MICALGVSWDNGPRIYLELARSVTAADVAAELASSGESGVMVVGDTVMYRETDESDGVAMGFAGPK